MKFSRNYIKNPNSRERFDKLAEFMDYHEFTVSDFLAVVCAHLAGYPQAVFETELMVALTEFKIRIEKK